MNFDAKVVGYRKVAGDTRILLDRAHLRGQDFSRRKLTKFSAVGCRLESCRFDRVRIQDGSFGSGREQSEYLQCSFDGARIRFSPGGYYRFVRCSFRDVDLRDWFCFAVEVVECTFSGRLRGAFFNGTVPEEAREIVGRDRNEFRGNDFSDIDLVDVAFRTGIDLNEQCLPSEPQYIYLPDAETAVRRARQDVVAWQDLKLRQAAMALLTTLEATVAGGQRQLLLRPDNSYKALGREAVDPVFQIFRAFAADPPK